MNEEPTHQTARRLAELYDRNQVAARAIHACLLLISRATKDRELRRDLNRFPLSIPFHRLRRMQIDYDTSGPIATEEILMELILDGVLDFRELIQAQPDIAECFRATLISAADLNLSAQLALEELAALGSSPEETDAGLIMLLLGQDPEDEVQP